MTLAERLVLIIVVVVVLMIVWIEHDASAGDAT